MTQLKWPITTTESKLDWTTHERIRVWSTIIHTPVVYGQITTSSLQQDLFGTLAERWRKETQDMSSVTAISMNFSYQRIIGLGDRAVPLILQELQQQPDHWFWALTAITGDDPVPPEHSGDIVKMTEDWLRWGTQRGYI